MGSEQSRDAPHHTVEPKKTEIANFDFRDNSKDGSMMIQQRQKSSHTQYNNNNNIRLERYEENLRKENHRSNSYWLEVGMDVVKRLDNGDNRFYSP